MDIDLDAVGALNVIYRHIGLTAAERRRVEADTGRARLVHHTERIHLTLESLETVSDGAADDGLGLVRREIDLLVSPGVVVTTHRGPLRALERFVAGLSGESSLGALQAAGLLSSLVDEVIAGFHEVAEHLERQIDQLDQAALGGDARKVRSSASWSRSGGVSASCAARWPRIAMPSLPWPDPSWPPTTASASPGRGSPSASRPPPGPRMGFATPCSAPTTSTWVVPPSAPTT